MNPLGKTPDQSVFGTRYECLMGSKAGYSPNRKATGTSFCQIVRSPKRRSSTPGEVQDVGRLKWSDKTPRAQKRRQALARPC